MRNIFFTIIFFMISSSIYGQEKYSLGFSFGVGKNYFKNSLETDSNHFKFYNPSSIAIGTQFVKHLNAKNHIVSQFEYTIKKVAFKYNTNESRIPYAINENIIEKYDCLSLSIGFRRTLKIKSLQTFVEIDLIADYNLNSSIGSKGTGNYDGNENTPLSESILYNSSSTDNIGKKSLTIGNTLSLGLNFGKKKHFEFSANINIPYNKIQTKTSSYQYQWEYQGNIYYHYLNYRGSIIYPSLKFAYYVFNK